jgi:hypothetical protein
MRNPIAPLTLIAHLGCLVTFFPVQAQLADTSSGFRIYKECAPADIKGSLNPSQFRENTDPWRVMQAETKLANESGVMTVLRTRR